MAASPMIAGPDIGEVVKIIAKLIIAKKITEEMEIDNFEQSLSKHSQLKHPQILRV